MKQYDSYKDSGIEWIGEVPSHWKVCKLKHIAKVFGRIGFRGYNQTDLVSEGEGAITLSPSNMQNGKMDYDKCSYLSWYKYNESPEIMIENGDILFVKTGSTYGKVSYVDHLPMEATINPQIVVFKHVKGNNKYLFYLLSNEIVQGQVSLTVGGSTIPTLSQESILSYTVPVAPSKEQIVIANYLDKKCSEIDNVISAQQKRIALLQELKQSVITHAVTKGLDPNVEMKDSGVEWIGEVPKHWEICKLKHVSSLYGRIGFRGYNQTDLVSEGEGAITLSPSNMQNGTMDYNICSFLSWKKYYESPEIMIKDGDILFVKTGSTYGKTSLVNKLPMEATINPQIVVFKDIKINNHFLYYLLTNDIVQMQVSLTVGGSTIPTLSQDNILNYVIPVAPQNEQDEIANYLDKKCKSIDTSISKAQHQVELLQEYKQSLITEVVTGKRKVS